MRLLLGQNNSLDQQHNNNKKDSFNSDIIVILSSLLCAVICVVGLFLAARCAFFRRFSAGRRSPQPPPPPPPHLPPSQPFYKGIRKHVLDSLPKFPFVPELLCENLSECAICLSEFEKGDEIRLLPQCGHGFHVVCIDTWLVAQSSCPSCRRVPVPETCHVCGGLDKHEVTTEHRTSS